MLLCLFFNSIRAIFNFGILILQFRNFSSAHRKSLLRRWQSGWRLSPSSCSQLSSFSRLIATPLHHHISHFLSEQFATFLQWNRISFRTPLDLLAESREGREGAGTTTREDRREAGGQVMSTTTAPDPRTGGMVSIMVMYRPPGAPHPTGAPGKTSSDQPPTYDSIFLGEQVP